MAFYIYYIELSAPKSLIKTPYGSFCVVEIPRLSIFHLSEVWKKILLQELCPCFCCCWTGTWHSCTSRCGRLGPSVQVHKFTWILQQNILNLSEKNFLARTNFLWWPTLLNSTTSSLNKIQILVSHLRSYLFKSTSPSFQFHVRICISFIVNIKRLVLWKSSWQLHNTLSRFWCIGENFLTKPEIFQFDQ